MVLLKGLPGRGAESAVQKGSMNETLKTIHNLRTIHGNFNDKSIPESLIQEILHASVQAANASNMQSYSIVVVKDRETMQAVCGYRGSCMFVYCVDHTRHHASSAHLGHAYRSDSIVSFVTAGMDTMLAAQTAVIAARSMGIDSLLTNGLHRGDMERVWKILNLPEQFCFPMIALVLGYPTEEPAVDKGRLGGVGIVHEATYHHPTPEELDAITSQYDNPDNHLALNPDWSQQGFTHYQDWLYSAWLGSRTGPPTEETPMFRLLKRAGYVDLQH